MKTKNNIAQIVFGMPIEGPFSYSVPEGLKEKIAVGKRVWVPFHNGTKVGYCIGIESESTIENLKPVQGVIDEAPLLSKEMLELARWVSQRYFCSWGEAIEATLPSALKKGKTKMRMRAPWEDVEYELSGEHVPNRRQGKIIDSINSLIEEGKHKTCLLYGITGSGKTEVYLQAIKKALSLGRSTIMLVPEISLTPQTAERFKSRFGDSVSVMHSRLTESQRLHEWEKIKKSPCCIVVGARSAVFSPVNNLGLIVIDEEHETAYKQEDAPRYHAREVAIKRAQLCGAVVVMGSATPSLESFYRARQGEYLLFELPERVHEKELPAVAIVDMRHDNNTRPSVLSKQLELELEKALKEKEQSILFLNRRGFSTYIFCRKCGFVERCKRCSVSMTYHSSINKLRCHICDYQSPPPKVCPKCQGSYLTNSGAGTQKVESEMARIFPQGRTVRMDTDATSKRGSHHRILSEFKEGKIDILIGTQMIAKGLDFPKVTLVGVISADTALNIPDFRASERTFNLLTQVAGRAGRGSKKGKVIIQTYMPFHYAIEAAKDHDYLEFYDKEIAFRKELELPPFTAVAEMTLRGKSDEKTRAAAEELCRDLIGENKNNSVKIIGPAPAVVEKIKSQYRWCLMAKSRDIEDLISVVRAALGRFKKPSGIFLAVDVEPL